MKVEVEVDGRMGGSTVVRETNLELFLFRVYALHVLVVGLLWHRCVIVEEPLPLKNRYTSTSNSPRLMRMGLEHPFLSHGTERIESLRQHYIGRHAVACTST